MQINKRITLIKYLNQSPQSIASFSQIKTVYTISQNNFIRFNSVDFENGEPQDFENFENGKSYIVISEDNANFELNTGSTSSLTNIQITSIKQIDIYLADSSYPIINLPNVNIVYTVSQSGNNFTRFSAVDFQNDEPQDFENFENGKVYIIFSSSVPYTLWPQEPIDPTVYVLKTENDDFIMTEDGYLLTTG